LGINDIIRGISPVKTRQNLDNILKRLHQKFPTCKIVILGLNAPDSIRTQRVYAQSSTEEIKEFKSLFPNLAKTYEAVLVPFFLQGVAGVPDLNFPDGLHPNNEGYKVIADQHGPFIKSVL
jgi:acyl-CoA thioesterase-1